MYSPSIMWIHIIDQLVNNQYTWNGVPWSNFLIKYGFWNSWRVLTERGRLWLVCSGSYGAWTADLVVHFMVKSQSKNWKLYDCEISQRHPNWWINIMTVTERRWEGITVGCQRFGWLAKKRAARWSHNQGGKRQIERRSRRPSNGSGFCKTAPTQLPSPQVPF